MLSDYNINVNKKSLFIYKNNQIKEKAPLHLAVEMEYIEIIQLLLNKKSINVDIKDDQNKKPIDYASNNEIKQLLIH